MSEGIWIGGIYLRDCGGYEIVLKSLAHYKKRLRTLRNSPELQGAAAMFGSVLDQQAAKTAPEIDKTVQKIKDFLVDVRSVTGLSSDVALMQKALSCYMADIKKAYNNSDEYFVRLVGDTALAQNDLPAIKTALDRLVQHLD